MSTDSANRRSPTDRYRRRRPWPVLILIVLLLAGGLVVWFQILKPGPAAATGCNKPGPAPVSATPTTRSAISRSGAATSGTARSTAGAGGTSRVGAGTTAATTGATPSTPVTTTLGTFVASNSLVAVRPSDPSTVVLQVFNASGARGVARTLTKDLQDSGFASIKAADNDLLYPAYDLVCQAEIRYGAAGQAQARTVLVVEPCAQLVMDDRIDQSVDLALGANFTYRPVTDAQKAALRQLHDAAAPPAVIEGVTAAVRPAAAIPALPTGDCSASAGASR